MASSLVADLRRNAATIIAGYLRGNPVSAHQIPALIGGVVEAFATLEQPVAPRSAVPISRSITPRYLVCLEDGKKLKTLNRYLAMQYKMTPDQYRKKWRLPSNYPMVAPNYAKRLSEIAKERSLGRRGARAVSRGRKAAR